MSNLGMLQDLERLEKRADEQTSVGNQEASVVKLEQKLSELKQTRDRLKEQVLYRKQLLSEIFDSNARKRRGRVSAQKQADSQKLLLHLKELKMKELISAYRLTGTMAKGIDSKTLRLCFDTCVQGEFVEPYYVEVAVNGEENGFNITKHTLPSFIPLTTITNSLTKGIREMVKTVHHFLSAYVTRRQTTCSLQNILKEHAVADLYVSQAFDCLTLTMTIPEVVPAPVEIKILFNSLTETKPSSINVCIKGAYEETALRNVITFFKDVLDKAGLSQTNSNTNED